MADFSYQPNVVHSFPAIPNIDVTQGQKYMQSSYKWSDRFLRKYELRFGYVNRAKRNLLRSHFEGQFGPYKAFNWINIPSYVFGIIEGSQVNYDEGSEGQGYYEETPEVGGNVFAVRITFIYSSSASFFTIDSEDDLVILDESGIPIYSEEY